MDFMEMITELRAKKKALADQVGALVSDGKFDELDSITGQMEDINKRIQALERNLEASRSGAEPVSGYDGLLHSGGDGGVRDKQQEGTRPFRSLGEQLQAIMNVSKSHTADKRLIQVNNAALGSNEGVKQDGGYILQEDFAGVIMDTAVQNSALLNRLDRYTCSSPANSMRWVSVDETDISSSVFGGVQMYWTSEANTDGHCLRHRRDADRRPLYDGLFRLGLYPGGGAAVGVQCDFRRRKRQAQGTASV